MAVNVHKSTTVRLISGDITIDCESQTCSIVSLIIDGDFHSITVENIKEINALLPEFLEEVEKLQKEEER